MEKIQLSDFLNFLDGLDKPAFKTEAVDTYFATHQFTPDAFTPYTHFREESYGRNLVAKNECYELLVLAWGPNQRTPIHDHHGQRCWVTMQAGELIFKNYQPYKPGMAAPVPMGGIVKHAAGEQAYIDDTIAMHSIANGSKENAVSVHLYAEPVPSCLIYSETNKQFETVELGYHTVPSALEGSIQSTQNVISRA